MVANATYRSSTRPSVRRPFDVEELRNEEREARAATYARSKSRNHQRNEQRRTQYASSTPRKGDTRAPLARHEEGNSWDVAQMLWAGIDKDAGNSVAHMRTAKGAPMLWSEGESLTVKIAGVAYDVTVLHAKYVSEHNRYTLYFVDLDVRLTLVEGQLMKLFVPAVKPVVAIAPATSLAIVPITAAMTTREATFRKVLRDAAETVANEAALQAKLAPMRHSERDFTRAADWSFTFGTMAGWLDDDHPSNWMGVAGL